MRLPPETSASLPSYSAYRDAIEQVRQPRHSPAALELTAVQAPSAGHVPQVTSAFDDELVTVKEITCALKIGPTKWWEGVKSGIYPQPIKLGSRCTRWSKSSIKQLMETGVAR